MVTHFQSKTWHDHALIPHNVNFPRQEMKALKLLVSCGY